MVANSHILLDTCILTNLISKEKNVVNETFNLLDNLSIKNKNKLYISEFTIYELLRGATDIQKKQLIGELNQIETIYNNSKKLDRAILLYSAYKKQPHLKSCLNSISDCDVFIGSLIFTKEKPYLLTADYCDFPRPLFIEKNIFPIKFRKGRGQKVCLYYYLLQANLDEF